MSDVELKPSSTKLYRTIRKLSSLNDDSKWDTQSFVMLIMLRGKNLEYFVKGGHKEGYNGTTNLLPDAVVRADDCMVSRIMTRRVHEENFVSIVPCPRQRQTYMWRALSSYHQNNSAGGRYMHLRAMMKPPAEGDDEVLKLIGSMDIL